jgi:hypothetical protein
VLFPSFLDIVSFNCLLGRVSTYVVGSIFTRCYGFEYPKKYKYTHLHILPQWTSLEVINILQQGATPALLTTNMTASTPDELVTGFPHNSLPKVTDEPTFEDLKIIRRYLNTNAMIVSPYEGGGLHGHLGLIMTNDEYFALATDVFTAPENSGATPLYPANATAAHISEANRAHTEAIRVYRT